MTVKKGIVRKPLQYSLTRWRQIPQSEHDRRNVCGDNDAMLGTCPRTFEKRISVFEVVKMLHQVKEVHRRNRVDMKMSQV